MVVGVYDRGDRTDGTEVADGIVNDLEYRIGRVNGVGQTALFGSGYAIRIWPNPYEMAAVGPMPSDVATAVEAQNTDVSAGRIGTPPTVKGAELDAVVNAKSRVHTPERFRDIVVKARSDGAVIKLSDIARVEMGDDGYNFTAQFNGQPAAGLALQLAPGTDARDRERGQGAGGAPPPQPAAGYTITYPRDTIDFIRLSVREVVKTLIVAVVLVVIVMFVFLWSRRATLVPAIAVPVVLLGTFGVLALFGHSINTPTLFGMVLAIELPVDDAIVVVENVERVMAEEDLGPREATEQSMDEIGSALVGIATVLSAVPLPMAFSGGSTGAPRRRTARRRSTNARPRSSRSSATRRRRRSPRRRSRDWASRTASPSRG